MAVVKGHAGGVRFGWMAAVFWLLALSAYVALLLFASSLALPRGVGSVLALLPPAVLLAWCLRFVKEPIPLNVTNRTLHDRVANLATLLRCARNEIVIVTGELNHKLYAEADVVEALRCVPRRVKIRLIHTTPEFDRASEPFIALLRGRVTPHVLDVEAGARTIAHAVVVDGKHSKVEQREVDNNADTKKAEYFFDDVSAAQKFLREIDSLTTKESAFPPPPSADAPAADPAS